MEKIDVVIPCYNENECVPLIFAEIRKLFENELNTFEWSVIYVDDGSSDGTLEQIIQLENQYGSEYVKYISFARNFGKEAAIYAGLEKSTADYVALMDADLQHPPELLTEMISAIKDKDYDCAAARRVSRDGEPPVRSFFSAKFYNVINKLAGIQLMPGMTDYRLMRADVAKAVVSLHERERFLKGIYSWIGFKTYWIPYENIERAAGKSKWSMRGLWNYAKSGFIAFANAPLRGAIYLGMIVVLLSVIYGIWILSMVISGERVWTESVTIILLLLFLGGTIITILGVIGEYLARIYMEAKGRPIYITRATNIKRDGAVKDELL